MKQLYTTSIAIVCFFIAIVASVAVVTAQEPAPSETPTETPIENSEFIFQQESVRPEIERLKVSYRGLIEEYRTKERQYQIAKSDYKQLNTLRSLEEAIRTTREVTVARTDVLLTYFELLKLELQESEGVELQKKNTSLSDIDSEIIYLREFKEQALAAQSREQVNALTPTFAEHRPILQNRGYYSLSLIMIGRLQAVHDKARVLESDIQTYLNGQEVAPFIQSQRERSYLETTKSLEEVNTILKKQITQLPVESGQSSYNNVRDNLGTVYVQLSQSLNYLQELLQL